MLTSLAFIFLAGLAMAAFCQMLKLPRIIGMLACGIILGPHVLDLLDPSILSISSELRQIALLIILLKAGLSLDLSDLKKVGRPAVMMSCVPAAFEILAFFLFAPHILGITGILGFVFAYFLEITGSLWASVLLHMGANIWSLILPELLLRMPEEQMITAAMGIYLVLLCVLGTGSSYFKKRACRRRMV